MKWTHFLRKMGFRTLVVTLVFACIHFTVVEETNDTILDRSTIFYYLSALLFFMLTWEANDRFIKKHLSRHKLDSLNWRYGLRILGITLLFAAPIFITVYYVAIFHFRDELDIVCNGGPLQQFYIDVSRALLLAVTVSVFNLFYFADKVKKQIHSRMVSLEKELIASKYKSLKSQISPHFLFNSLNTLTALMYEDRDLASDFTNRLASCYRYILDNRDKDLVGLNKELTFLDSFIFMMNVRHKMSLKISTHISLNTSNYVIPTLSLQMLVENALKHNYYSKEQPLLITITNTEDALIIENTHRKRHDVTTSTQMGLENIKKRFDYYTKNPVVITKTESIFSVSLPLLKTDIEIKSPLSIVS